MQLRSFILMSLCATMFVGGPAHAAPLAATAAPKAPAVTDVVEVAAKSASAELRTLKRKKKPTDEDLARIKELEKQVKIEQAAARAKAIEARKLAMREAAKAKSEAARKEFLEKRNQSRTARAEKPEPARPTPAKAVVQAKVEEVREPLSADALSIARTGNNGELRSESRDVQQQRRGGLLTGLFGSSSSAGSSIAYLPETRALDSVLQERQAKKKFNVKPEFEPQQVNFTGYEAGTIVIDTSAHRLYLVESAFTARRYAIAVGRDGLQYKGTTVVGDKQEWPRWIPTKEMQQREPAKYGRYKDGMPGGPDNPLGARAIYLYEGKKDTYLRIHGTNQPQTIGTNSSNGCFRMINDHVMDLYRRVKTGTKVVVL